MEARALVSLDIFDAGHSHTGSRIFPLQLWWQNLCFVFGTLEEPSISNRVQFYTMGPGKEEHHKQQHFPTILLARRQWGGDSIGGRHGI